MRFEHHTLYSVYKIVCKRRRHTFRAKKCPDICVSKTPFGLRKNNIEYYITLHTDKPSCLLRKLILHVKVVSVCCLFQRPLLSINCLAVDIDTGVLLNRNSTLVPADVNER